MIPINLSLAPNQNHIFCLHILIRHFNQLNSGTISRSHNGGDSICILVSSLVSEAQSVVGGTQ